MKVFESRNVLFFAALFLCIGLTVSVQPSFAQDEDNVHEQQDDDDDDDKYDTPEMQKLLAKEAKITREEARAIALTRVPGTVIESELDKEKGKVVWEFEIKTEEGKVFEVAVDAITGDIVLVEDETDEEDDDEDGPDGQAARLTKQPTREVKSAT